MALGALSLGAKLLILALASLASDMALPVAAQTPQSFEQILSLAEQDKLGAAAATLNNQRARLARPRGFRLAAISAPVTDGGDRERGAMKIANDAMSCGPPTCGSGQQLCDCTCGRSPQFACFPDTLAGQQSCFNFCAATVPNQIVFNVVEEGAFGYRYSGAATLARDNVTGDHLITPKAAWRVGSGIAIHNAVDQTGAASNNGEATFVSVVTGFGPDPGNEYVDLIVDGTNLLVTGTYAVSNDDSIPIQTALRSANHACDTCDYYVDVPAGTYPIGAANATFNYTPDFTVLHIAYADACQTPLPRTTLKYQASLPLVICGSNVHLRGIPGGNGQKPVLRIEDNVVQARPISHSHYVSWGLWDKFSYGWNNVVAMNANNWYRSSGLSSTVQTNLSVTDIEIDGNKANQPAFYEPNSWTWSWTQPAPTVSIHKDAAKPADCDSVNHCIQVQSIADAQQVYFPHYSVFVRFANDFGNLSPPYESGDFVVDNAALAAADGAGGYNYLKLTFAPPPVPNWKAFVYVAYYRNANKPDNYSHITDPNSGQPVLGTAPGFPDTDDPQEPQRPLWADCSNYYLGGNYVDPKNGCGGAGAGPGGQRVLMYQRYVRQYDPTKLQAGDPGTYVRQDDDGPLYVLIGDHLPYIERVAGYTSRFAWGSTDPNVNAYLHPGYKEYGTEPPSGLEVRDVGTVAGAGLSLTRVYVHDTVQNGINFYGSIYNSTFTDVRSDGNGQSGMAWANAGLTNVSFSGSAPGAASLSNNERAGLDWETYLPNSNVTIDKVGFYNNSSDAIGNPGNLIPIAGGGVLISNNEFGGVSSGVGVNFAGGPVLITNNVFYPPTGPLNSGWSSQIQSTKSNSAVHVEGNAFYDSNGHSYHVLIDGAQQPWTFDGNTFRIGGVAEPPVEAKLSLINIDDTQPHGGPHVFKNNSLYLQPIQLPDCQFAKPWSLSGIGACFNKPAVLRAKNCAAAIASFANLFADQGNNVSYGWMQNAWQAVDTKLQVYVGEPDHLNPCPQQPPPFLQNADFETGTLAGWTSVDAAASVSASAHSGSWAVQVGSTSPTNGDSTLTQTLTLPPNATTLSFWYNVHCPDAVFFDWARAELVDNTNNAMITMLDKQCTNGVGWQQAAANVAAMAGHSMTLTLVSHDDNSAADPAYTWFDDVSVQ